MEKEQMIVTDPEMMKLLKTIANSMKKNHQTIGKNEQILYQNDIKILKKLDSIEEKLEEMAKRQLSAWLDSVKKFKEKLKNAKTPQEEAIYAQALKESMPQEGELDTIIEDAFPQESDRKVIMERLERLDREIESNLQKAYDSILENLSNKDASDHNRYVALADRLNSIESIIRSIDSEVGKTYHMVNAMPREHY